MKFALKAGIAALALCAAAPASATLTLIPGFPCSPTTTDPDALACAGSYAGNLNDAADIADLNAALDALVGGGGFDPDLVWSQSIDDTKAFFDETGGVLTFGSTLYGQNILSIHFGGAGFYPPGTGGGTILYLFDFGSAGADSITLNQQGFSNSILIGGGVPEPATWAMMLLGFGAVGFSMRRRRRALMPQVA